MGFPFSVLTLSRLYGTWMNTPDHLKYTPAHHWVKQEADGTISVGITFHAQEALGDIVFVQGPEPGRELTQGAACGVIESVKAASDLHAPVSGEVVAVSAEAADKPELINADPYGTWLFRMRPTHVEDVDALLDAVAYSRLASAETGKS